MSKAKISRFPLVLVALLALVIGIYFQQSEQSSKDLPSLEKAIILPAAKNINGIEFVDHRGNNFGVEDLEGKWSILFFGFTNCPDICPTTMHTLKQVKQQLSESQLWGNYQVIMVSVDPARDTPEQLANYVPFFDSEFIGITASEKITTEFARQLGILFIEREADANGRYDVDHGTSLILVNPRGQMAGVISAPHKVEQISHDLGKLAEHFAQDHVVDTSLEVVPSTPVRSQAERTNKFDSTKLQVNNAWIRTAPPTVSSMAGYGDFVNTSDEDIIISAANSTSFGMVMIHDTIIEDGIASMEHRDELIIKAKETVSLQPLGTHMMLMQPSKALIADDTVEVSFTTENGVEFSVEFKVQDQANPNSVD